MAKLPLLGNQLPLLLNRAIGKGSMNNSLLHSSTTWFALFSYLHGR